LVRIVTMPTTPDHGKGEWFRHSFDELYPSLYGHRGIVEARDLLACLSQFIPLTERRVLDVGCGPGRYLRALVERGGRPIGVDLSLPLLQHARRTSAEFPLVRADMRSLPFRAGSFGAVLLMFTTFGYFLDDEDDLQVLRDIASLLDPDGRFVLDYINTHHLRDHLVPFSERRLESRTVEDRRWIEEGGKFLHKESRVTDAGGGEVRIYRERLRLYDAAQIDAMFGAAGLAIERRLGDYEGRPFDESTSARLLVIAGRERGTG
jgi:SAM-dependent methyltransferase